MSTDNPYRQDELDELNRLVIKIQARKLLNQTVTVTKQSWCPEFRVVRGCWLDDHRGPLVLLARDQADPQVEMIHWSWIQELGSTRGGD
jgi:hypothetical protein